MAQRLVVLSNESALLIYLRFIAIDFISIDFIAYHDVANQLVSLAHCGTAEVPGTQQWVAVGFVACRKPQTVIMVFPITYNEQ